ncbi:glycosyltransferase family 2 protein [Yoonia sp. R2331]|uniref:glycosyltransferase family 2 protein n=1 Tax=Yoonia sp. R2331 TaxID=3237238 RepID=UPI0034E5A78C
MPSEISVSIINYKTGDMTLSCVQSVLDDIGDLAVDIVVVDNASGDGSAEQIAEWIAAHPNMPVKLVRSDENTGFSGGHNLGITNSDGAYVLVLNSDALLKKGFLKAIMDRANSAPNAGMIAPRLVGDDGTEQISRFRFASPLSELERAAATGPITKLLRRSLVALPKGAPEDKIDWASFACILLNRDMINQIGLMDDDYFLYFEDAEYCLRAQRAGWRIVVTDLATAIHFRGGSGPVKALEKARKRMPTYFYASRSRFLRQAHGYSGLILANLCWHLGRAIAHLKRLAGKEVYPAVENEARDIWIGARAPLKPYRQANQ